MEVMSMVPQLNVFHQYVVYVDLHVPSYLALEYFVHKPLICCPYILLIERNDLVTIQALISDKRGLLLVFRMHEDLVVARKCIHKAEQLVPGGRVNQCIDAWEKEAVFWIGLVEVDEVHTHPPLLHQDHIRQLVEVVDFLDELCL